MLTTCRNALSVLDLLVKVIGSAVVASTFSSWTAGGVWGFVVVSTIVRTIRNWERQEGLASDVQGLAWKWPRACSGASSRRTRASSRKTRSRYTRTMARCSVSASSWWQQRIVSWERWYGGLVIAQTPVVWHDHRHYDHDDYRSLIIPRTGCSCPS